MKLAHSIVCLRNREFTGDIQDLLDSSKLFEFEDSTISNLRVECVLFIQNLQLTYLTSRKSIEDSGFVPDNPSDILAPTDEQSDISAPNSPDSCSDDATFHSDPVHDEYLVENSDGSIDNEDEIYQPSNIDDDDDIHHRVGGDISDENFRNDCMEDATRAAASVLSKGDAIEYTSSLRPCNVNSTEVKLSHILSIKPLALGGHRIMLENDEQLKEDSQFVRQISSMNHVTGEAVELPEPLWLMLSEYTLICDEPVYTDRVRHSSGLSQSEASNAAKRDRNLDRHNDRRPRHLFPWIHNKDEYNKAATTLNTCYRKLCEIGERHLLSEGEIDMMTVTTEAKFMEKAREINLKYKRSVKPSVKKIRLPSVAGVPDKVPMWDEDVPSEREVKQNETTLDFEHKMCGYGIRTCTLCRENKDVFVKSENDYEKPFKCPSGSFCYKRNYETPNYYLAKNMQPIWYEREDDGSFKLDHDGGKVIRYDIPPELKNLTISEGLLIRRFSPYIPSIHIRNGTFGIKGHCCTFPQNIDDLCNVLPQRKETILTFVRHMTCKGTKTTSVKNLRVNRQRILEALYWLKDHHTGYRNIIIDESNLDWMGGKDEGIIATETELAKDEEAENERNEFVSTAHEPQVDGEVECFTAQCNTKREIPTSDQAVPINELADLARATGQASKVCDFPTVDLTNPVS